MSTVFFFIISFLIFIFFLSFFYRVINIHYPSPMIHLVQTLSFKSNMFIYASGAYYRTVISILRYEMHSGPAPEQISASCQMAAECFPPFPQRYHTKKTIVVAPFS